MNLYETAEICSMWAVVLHILTDQFHSFETDSPDATAASLGKDPL